MKDPAFPVFASIAIILVLLPAPWHWQARNSGTLLYIAWVVTGNLIFLVNAIIWAGNLRNPAPIWCDISSKIIVGFGVALPATSLCINRQLYRISAIQQITTSAQKRRHILIDVFIGLGLPMLIMALHYVVQGHRFNILEDIGCWPTTYNTPPGIVVVMVPPILIGLISFVYCSLSIRAFMQRRSSFNTFLSSTESGLTVNRYFRLMALAAIEMCFCLPLAIYHLVQTVRDVPIYPWISWEDTHWGFDRVDLIPASYFERNPILFVDLNIARWSLPFGGFVFFIFFGLTGESRKNYVRFYLACLRQIGIVPKPSKPRGSTQPPPSLLSSFKSSHDVSEEKALTSPPVVYLPDFPPAAMKSSSIASSVERSDTPEPSPRGHSFS